MGSTTTELDSESALLFDGAKLLLNESADGNLTTGLTINQGSASDFALTLKSSSVAHGVTGEVETDTFGAFLKASGSEGGFKYAVMRKAEKHC